MLNKRLREHPELANRHFPILVDLRLYAVSCLMPLQIARLVERLPTLSTIEDWSVAVHSLHVSLHVAKLAERLVADFTRIIVFSTFVIFKPCLSASDRVVFFVLELDMSSQ